MSDRPYEGAPIKPVAYLMLLTDAVDLFEDRKLLQLTGAQLSGFVLF